MRGLQLLLSPEAALNPTSVVTPICVLLPCYYLVVFTMRGLMAIVRVWLLVTANQ